MKTNYLIDEIHTFRQKQASAFNNDLEAICNSAIERQKTSGHRVVKLSSKAAQPYAPEDASPIGSRP